jgi:hypothetical protein
MIVMFSRRDRAAVRIATIAALLLMIPTLAFAGGEPLGSSSAPSLYSPSYNTLGKAIGNRVTTMTPDGALEPTGTLPSGSDDLARGVREDNKELLERHLDCFSGAVPPDRDIRNSFQSRCPGNSR